MTYSTSYISQVTLSTGTYDIKDTWAREKVAGLQGAMHFVGVSTTDPTSEAGPTIEGHTGDYVSGDVCVYTPTESGKQEQEYVYNGASWQEFGSTGSLKALAFKDDVSGSVTLTGTCTPGALTMDEQTHTHTVTKSDVSVSVPFTPAGTVSGTKVTLATSEGAASKVATVGSVSAGSTPTLGTAIAADKITSWNAGSVTTVDTTKFNGGTPTKVAVTAGSDASISTGAAAEWSASVSGETLSFSFTPNTLQTLSGGKATTVSVTDGAAASLGTGFYTAGAAPSLVYTEKSIPNVTSVGKATEVTLPTFTSVDIVTGVESITDPTFTGTTGTATGSGSADIVLAGFTGTPTGSVAAGTSSVSGNITLS